MTMLPAMAHNIYLIDLPLLVVLISLVVHDLRVRSVAGHPAPRRSAGGCGCWASCRHHLVLFLVNRF